MKVTGLHVFLILLATIVFCSCLGKEKKVIEGMGGRMLKHEDKDSKRNDIKRREERERRREIENYRKKNRNEHIEYEERLRRLEKKEREQRERRRELRDKQKKRKHHHYDEHDELYSRMMQEQYDERPAFDKRPSYHVDDHHARRKTRNRARMVPPTMHSDDSKYMLKSQVVPPGGCSACAHGGPSMGPGMGPGGGPGMGPGMGPGANNNPSSEERPCPPCGRCPEPSFDCKKVPNYNSRGNSGILPKPVLSDFSTFGA